MKLSNLTNNSHAYWDHSHIDTSLLTNPEKMIQSCNLNLTVPGRLMEVTYKEISSLIDNDFLQQKIRADALRGVNFRGFEDDTMIFDVRSSKFDSNRLIYKNSVQFTNWNDVGQSTDVNNIEKARLLLWAGDLKLRCTCPSFLYWGYQYLLTVLDGSIDPENRKPVRRNPGDKGIFCKHMNRVFRVLPFFSSEIAKELKKQFGS